MLGLIRRFVDHGMDQFALWQFHSQARGTVLISSLWTPSAHPPRPSPR